MPILRDIQIPPGWVERNGGPVADISRSGRPGRRSLQSNDPLFCWMFAVSYKRSTNPEEEAGAKFDQVYAFFLVASGFYFLVDDIADNTHDANLGSGIIKLLNGVPRLHKRYAFGGIPYDHPITRPKGDVVVSDGVLDFDTGIVSGLDVPEGADESTVLGTWTGGFLRPMLLAENGLNDSRTPDGIVKAFNVQLEEVFEF